MRSSTHPDPKKQRGAAANDLIDSLETAEGGQGCPPDFFGKDFNTLHHNTHLLQALAWNRKIAARKLIEHDKHKISINLKDDFPTCQNTPLILAAKINDADLVADLIAAGAFVNERDYRGFTALHYACLYRNNAAIRQLLAANASLELIDAFGKSPHDYYLMDISETDLGYPYGEHEGMLNKKYDWDNRFFASNKKCLTALRWYILHIIVNNDLGKTIQLKATSLYDIACQYLQKRIQVFDAVHYKLMMKCFVENRPQIIVELQQMLTPCEQTDYQRDEIDMYRLHPLDLIPASAIRYRNGETWVQLQEFKRSSGPVSK